MFKDVFVYFVKKKTGKEAKLKNWLRRLRLYYRSSATDDLFGGEAASHTKYNIVMVSYDSVVYLSLVNLVALFLN